MAFYVGFNMVCIFALDFVITLPRPKQETCDLKAEDSGYYRCVASNNWGSDEIMLNLQVQGVFVIK